MWKSNWEVNKQNLTFHLSIIFLPVQKNPKLQECIKKRGQKEKIERKDEKMKSKVSKKKTLSYSHTNAQWAESTAIIQSLNPEG